MQRNVLAAALLCAITLSACRSVDDSPTAIDKIAVRHPSAQPPSPPASPLEEDRDQASSQPAHKTGQAQDSQPSLAPPRAPVPMVEVAPSSVTVDAMRGRASEASRMMALAAPAPILRQMAGIPDAYAAQAANTEHYAGHGDNPVHRASEQPVSTFSIDVDTGSYTNVRRMLNQGVRPPVDAVRAEEMINYFSYGHPAPTSLDVPFRVTTELAPAPWNTKNQLLMVGIKGYDVPKAKLPPANLVFLIDTSGSMESPEKLPLLKQAFSTLVKQLRPQDHVSIVVYAGSAGLVLPPTSGDKQDDILAALDRLQAGGSTNGGDGIRLAYAMAKQGFVKGGVNRVMLATDGDFNVGIVDQRALETLVADQRKSGIALTTLGFGTGNYNDALAEKLADVGDGNHAYIDSAAEARKVLVQQMGGTLLTIAKDVKIQIEFNPAQVAEYRLIGYENRILRREDFANDKVDAGDIGSGHEVTALYEITPVGSDATMLPALKYGEDATPRGVTGKPSSEIADLRLRYKRPGETSSRLIDTPILRSSLHPQPSATLRFAAVVAAYADGLRGGTHLGAWGWSDIIANARAVDHQPRQRGASSTQRAEFVQLAESARRLIEGSASQIDVSGAIAPQAEAPQAQARYALRSLNGAPATASASKQ